MKFSVPDMSCGHCKAAITTKIKDLDGTADLDFDMEGRVVTVKTSHSQDEITSALKDAGYDSTPV